MKCRHTRWHLVDADGRPILHSDGGRGVANRCSDCRLVGVRPLGPSNDDSDAVRVEMRAAELVGQGFGPMTEMERTAYQQHDSKHFTPDLEGLAGWLAHEINLVRNNLVRNNFTNHDAYAWAWDITRPLAEQFAETAAVASPSMCEACSTPEGCGLHRMFTCADCKRRVPWSDGSDDVLSDMCSECLAKQQVRDESDGAP